MKQPLRISLVQLDTVWEQPQSNRMKLEDILLPLEGLTDLIILPEMFTTGFTMNAKALAEPMDGPSLTWLLELSIQLQTDITGSLIIEEGGYNFNRLVWVGPSGLKATYDKRHLFSLAGEEKVYTAGKEKTSVSVKDWEVLPLICYDLRFPVWSRNDLEADILLYVANWPERRRYAWNHLLIARAIENQAFVIGVNRVGWDGLQHFYAGESVVLDPIGRPLLQMGNEEEVSTIDLDFLQLETIRYKLPFLKDRDPFIISTK